MAQKTRDSTIASVANGESIESAMNVFRALIGKRLSDRYNAVEALGDPDSRADRATLRVLLLRAIRDDFYAGREVELDDHEIAFTRSWLLNVLARVADDDAEAAEFVIEHLSQQKEPNNWARFWVLQGLISGSNARAGEMAKSVASREGDPLPAMLATAYIASRKDATALRKLRDGLTDPKTQWYVLRALREVPLPASVGDVCKIVDTARHSDETYDAIMALGVVPRDWSQASLAVQSLSACVGRLRGSPWKDGMRTGAIKGLGNLKAESAAAILIDELTDDNPAIAREAARALQKILGLSMVVIRIVEAASKGERSGIDAYGRALRWLDRDKTAEELGHLMASGSTTQHEIARTLLRELGGSVAFEKLRARTDAMKQYNDVLEGVVPLPVEIEVAVQPTPRGFSGLIPEGTADEEHCQEDTASGSHTAAASRHAGGARSGPGRCTARARATAPDPREAPGVRDQRGDGCAGWSA